MCAIYATSGICYEHLRAAVALPRAGLHMTYEATAVELIRELRGKRSRAELSRRIGYRSNIVHRWETGHSWPTTSRFLQAYCGVRPAGRRWLQRFFHSPPDWVAELEPSSPQAVAAFLRFLRGKAPIASIAERAGYHRSSVSRWLSGAAEPKLPEFLRLVDAMSRRLPDFVATLVDPARLPSLQRRWQRLQLARKAGYDVPWSHAVLRALELAGMPSGAAAQQAWLAERLRLGEAQVREALLVLEGAAQVEKTARGYRVLDVLTIDTGQEPERARALKIAWHETALARLKAGTPGRSGYSVFAVSRADLRVLHDLHMQYVRAMQEVIARSTPSDCVGLYCSHLLDLGERPTASQASRAG